MIFEFEAQIRAAAKLLHDSRYPVAFTGAGISTPSGIPDFRSAGSGLWKKDDPMQVASLSTFIRNPEILYNWLYPLADNAKNAQPNPAHYALVNLESEQIIKAVLTQNIDDLHQRAGSKEVLPVHGSLDSFICLDCKIKYDSAILWEAFINQRQFPRCERCHKFLKPDIVLFEEILPQAIWDRAVKHAEKADLILVIGSSLQVYPANHLPEIAYQNGAKMIINNLTPTFMDSYADVVIQSDIAEVIPTIAGQLI